MIEKLKCDISEWSDGSIKDICPPSTDEIVSKINQIIDYLNSNTPTQEALDLAEPKPKFKIDDWITNGEYIVKISEVRKKYYDCLEGNHGFGVFVINIDKADENYHLWTINDAKDGDVLYFNDDTIVIFKDLYNSSTFHSYCHIEDDIFNISKDEMPDWWECKGFQPATEEQRNILFQKMKKAGYEWDNEKKEVKKIEQTQEQNLTEFEQTLKRIIRQRGGWLSSIFNDGLKDDAEELLAIAKKELEQPN